MPASRRQKNAPKRFDVRRKRALRRALKRPAMRPENLLMLPRRAQIA